MGQLLSSWADDASLDKAIALLWPMPLEENQCGLQAQWTQAVLHSLPWTHPQPCPGTRELKIAFYWHFCLEGESEVFLTAIVRFLETHSPTDNGFISAAYSNMLLTNRISEEEKAASSPAPSKSQWYSQAPYTTTKNDLSTWRLQWTVQALSDPTFQPSTRPRSTEIAQGAAGCWGLGEEGEPWLY